MTPTDDPALYPDFLPEPTRHISSPEGLRALSDPTRMRLLEVMVQRQDPPWSVKELAAALGVPQTRLYHHVDQLVAHDLVRAVERRVVSGIIETRYRVTSLNYQIDRRLFEGDPDEATRVLHETLVTVFDTARDEIEAAMRSGAIDPSGSPDDVGMLLSRGILRLPPDRAAELRRRLIELQQEFDDDTSPDGRAWGVVLAVYPLPDNRKDPSDG